VNDRDTDIAHLIDRRGLTVPNQDRALLLEYWGKIRTLRAAADERLLAGSEIAVTWTAVSSDAG